MKSKKKSAKSKKNTAKLIINSNTYQLPIHKATEGNDVPQPQLVSQKLPILTAKKEYFVIEELTYLN